MNLQNLKNLDWPLFAVSILLILVGLTVIFSTSFDQSSPISLNNFYRQVFFVILALFFYFLVKSINYRLYFSFTAVFYLIIIILLASLLIFGQGVRGAKSWFHLGIFRLQPSEYAKIVMILVLAKYLSKYSPRVLRFKHFFLSFLYTLIPISLIAKEPDLGTAFILFCIWLGMVLIRGVKKWQFVFILSVVILGMILSWFFMLQDYQKTRLLVFLHPTKDPLGAGYNVLQSMIAVGSGQLLGRGLGHGPQSQLKFLPEQHTDFIFAVIAEELGLVGGAIVLFLFLFLFYRLYKISLTSSDNFGKLIITGVFVMLFSQTFINIGMNVGIMPITGLTLPLVSYGGSSLLTTMIALAIVQNIKLRSVTKFKPEE